MGLKGQFPLKPLMLIPGLSIILRQTRNCFISSFLEVPIALWLREVLAPLLYDLLGSVYFFWSICAAAAKSLQSCPTLYDPIDGSPPGSPVPGILQARALEWVTISFSNAWKWKLKVKLLSHVWLFATPWTAAYQAPPSMGFARQEYWIGVPLPSPIHYLIQHLLSYVQAYITLWGHKNKLNMV